MCGGFASTDRLLTNAKPTPGSVLVLIGASTGRDGIGGVSVLASRTLEEDAHASRPSVQIGDPFAEKLLIEACLELVDRDLLEGLQDLGGAGLTCAVSESASRAGVGVELNLDAVPLRAPDMEPFEILTSESQERMLAIVAPGNLASKRWAYRQYDQLVQGQTVEGPGGDAAVVRIEGTLKAMALSSDGKGRYGSLDPYLGAAHAVAESARNVACVGARPLAVTNCLNFGNPERAEVMWQFAEAVRGLGDACRALGTPVTGGNVSFYNEAGDSAIWPTPIIGMLGVIDDYRLRTPSGFPGPGHVVYLLGE